MLIAQISDTHILAPGQLLSDQVDTAHRLQHCINAINHFSPNIDCVVATGDLVHHGSVEEYQCLRQLLAPLTKPIYLLPGNHDNRENLKMVFSDHDYFAKNSEFLQFVCDDWAVRIIGLDSVVTGNMGGELCSKRLDWLEQQLKINPIKPTVIMLHHPPFRTGIKAMDLIRCNNTDSFSNVVKKFPNIQRILCGHVHRPITTDCSGIVTMSAPAVCAQLTLELNELAPDIIIPWSHHEKSAMLLHHYSPSHGINSHHYSIPMGT